MKNLPCVIWLVGAQFANSYSAYIHECLLKKTYSDDVQFIAASICLFLWAFIGIKLYQPKGPKL